MTDETSSERGPAPPAPPPAPRGGPPASAPPPGASPAPILDPTSYRSIWTLAWPVMIHMGAHTAFGVVDLFWVSQLGTDAVAAVSLIGNIIFSLFGLTQIVYMGALAMLTRRLGANKLDGPDGAGAVASQAVQLSVVLGCVITGLGLAFMDPIISVFGAGERLTTLSIAYFAPMVASFLPVFPAIALGAVFTAAGDTRTPMYVGVGVTAVNAIIDPVLILGWDGTPLLRDLPDPLVALGLAPIPAMGIAGAGIASLFATLLNLAAAGVLFRVKRFPFATGRVFAWYGAGAWTTLLRIGIPGSLGMLFRPLSTVILLGVIARFGAEGVAAFGVTVRAMSLVWLYHGALATAVGTLTGQSLGARNTPGIYAMVRKALGVSLGIAVTTGVIYFALPREIIGIFEKHSQEVLDLGALFMRLLVLSHFTTCFSLVWGAVMNGAGYTRPPMIIAFAANWIVKLPLAWALALPLGVGVEGVWYAMFVSLVFESAAVWTVYRREQWMHTDV